MSQEMTSDAMEDFVALQDAVESLVTSGPVPRVAQLTSLEFLRNYVSQNRPVVITDLFRDAPALRKWSLDYLRETIGETEITVDFTPDGYGDAVKCLSGLCLFPVVHCMP